MGSSLYRRLFFAFSLVSLLAVVIAGVILVARQRDQQREAAVDRAAAAAPVLAIQLGLLGNPLSSPQRVEQLIEEGASRWNVRIFLLSDHRTVLYDSDNSLLGHQLAPPPRDANNQRGIYLYWTSNEPEEGGLVFLTVAQLEFGQRFDQFGFRQGFEVVVAVPEDDIAGAWRSLIRSLIPAGIIAVVAAALLAAAIARWIARPMLRLTQAAKSMATGQPADHVDTGGPTEVRELGDAFNAMAAEVSRSQLQMRTLVGSASHDLRTPLTSIVGYAQALRDGTIIDQDDARHAGDVIYGEAQRMTGMVTDLLYLSQIDARTVALRRDDVNLAAVARDGIAGAPPLAVERGIAFDLHADEGIFASADHNAVTQVTAKLIDNAARYAAGGSRVDVIVSDAGGASLAVSSEGTPPAGVERLFERFYRGDAANGGGTGLGLAIAKELVTLMGGTIEAEATAGRTIVTVRLPAAGRPSSEATGQILQ